MPATRSYPYLSDLFRDLTGLDLPLPLPMFGLLVLVAVVVAGLVLRSELRRRWRAGQLVVDGRPGAVDSLQEVDDFTGTFTAAMLLAGIAGAKLFSLAEDPGAVLADPVGAVVSSSGFNIIGGLVVATLVGVLMVRRRSLHVPVFLDAAAPAVMLGYAIGRIGCQVSGDGDWGLRADLADKPGWLPTWLWAQTYEGNILGVTIPEPGVYPTPLWETAMALVLFALLWSLRRHAFRPGWLFALWLVLGAAERLAIEPLRVNEVHGPWQLSQAQYLSAVMLVAGLVGVALLSRRVSRGSESPRRAP